MPTLVKHTTIKAPVERVFAYVDDPINLPQIWPSLYEIKDVEELPNGGHKFVCFYNMAGKRIEETVETFEHVAYKRIVDKVFGPIESTFTWTFAGENGTTEVEFKADYEMVEPLLEKEDEPFLLWRNQYEADALLANLKARFEG